MGYQSGEVQSQSRRQTTPTASPDGRTRKLWTSVADGQLPPDTRSARRGQFAKTLPWSTVGYEQKGGATDQRGNKYGHGYSPSSHLASALSRRSRPPSDTGRGQTPSTKHRDLGSRSRSMRLPPADRRSGLSSVRWIPRGRIRACAETNPFPSSLETVPEGEEKFHPQPFQGTSSPCDSSPIGRIGRLNPNKKRKWATGIE